MKPFLTQLAHKRGFRLLWHTWQPRHSPSPIVNARGELSLLHRHKSGLARVRHSYILNSSSGIFYAASLRQFSVSESF